MFVSLGFLFIKYLISGNHTLFGYLQNLFSHESSILLKVYAALSLVLIILATIYSLYLWSFGSWKNHPAVKVLSLYAESIEPTSGLPQSSSPSRQSYSWRHVACIIDIEFGYATIVTLYFFYCNKFIFIELEFLKLDHLLLICLSLD